MILDASVCCKLDKCSIVTNYCSNLPESKSKLRTKAKNGDDGMETNSDSDADSDDYEDDIRANGPSAKAFYIPTTSRPSAQTSSFNYRWRGELREKKDNPENTGSGSI